MRLFVIDPGLHAAYGHHFILNEMIAGECMRRAIGLEVWAARDFVEGNERAFAARAVFRHHPYTHFRRVADFDVLRTTALSSTVTQEDLASVATGFACGDQFLVHTPALRQLFGVYGWYSSLAAPRPRLAMTFRFPPWYLLEEDDRAVAVALHAQAFRLWRSLPADEVAFAADSRALAGLLQPAWPREIAVLPIPLSPPIELVAPDRADGRGRLNVLFAGDARPEKGLRLLLAILREAVARHAHLHVTIQCANAAPRERDLLQSRFEELQGRVSLVLEPLPLAAYHRLVASADALLVAYDPEQYTYRTSHVFVDALAHAKPVIYTAGSWMDGEAAALAASAGPIGPRMTSFSAAALSQALDDLVANFGPFAAAARQAAPVWRARHNISAYLDAVLGSPVARPMESAAK